MRDKTPKTITIDEHNGKRINDVKYIKMCHYTDLESQLSRRDETIKVLVEALGTIRNCSISEQAFNVAEAAIEKAGIR